MTKTVYEPRPRFVVQVGDVVRSRVDGTTHAMSWEFETAFDGIQMAKDRADLLARNTPHVRVVDRGEEGRSE